MQKISSFNFVLAILILIINFWFKEWALNINILQGNLLDLLLIILLSGFTIWSIAGFKKFKKFLYLIAAVFMGIAAIAKLMLLL